MNYDIDFVIPWVDDSDPSWRASFAKYKGEAEFPEETDSIRYEEHGLLPYLFRGIEKFTPWVRKVHLVTCGQYPQWLNLSAPKLNLVFHKDYIDNECLPVFSSRPIENNLHRIKDLSDRFVLFNDDIYPVSPTPREFFFRNGLPCDSAILRKLPKVLYDGYFTAVHKDVELINRMFNKKRAIWAHPLKWFNLKYGVRFLFPPLAFIGGGSFSGFKNHHSAQPYLKSTYEKVWKAFPNELNETNHARFRTHSDVNQLLFRYWQLAEGSFHPTFLRRGRPYYEIDQDIEKIINALDGSGKAKIVCINDAANSEANYKRTEEAFKRLLPEKSSFEK